MKSTVLILIGLCLTVVLRAQDVTVSFRPDDANAFIDSVLAVNLNTNDSVMLAGGETLTLKNTTTGITSFLNGNSSLYPNPTDGTATLQFPTKFGGKVAIQLFDATGQLLLNQKQNLAAGTHNFILRFPGPGIYVVSARAGDALMNFREISTQTEKQEVSLFYSGYSQLSADPMSEIKTKSVVAGKTLSYSKGNNIMYTIYSGVNMRVMVDQPAESKIYGITFYPCADKDGRNYKTVTIGAQIWMAENLVYLPSVNRASESSSSSARYYVYDYNGTNVTAAKATTNYKTFGVLYNWPAARAVCPVGWHLPSDAEWTTLSNYLGGESVAGGKMKSTTGWESPNTGATNESCFSALPGGACNAAFGSNGAGLNGTWWSSTPSIADYAWNCYLGHSWSSLSRSDSHRSLGYSVRCIRD